MKRLLSVFLISLIPVGVIAQPVQVLTGEHADFTRVVVQLPEVDDWVFGRSNDGYKLKLSDIDEYDLRRFFDLIPRTRISNVSQDATAGTLHILLNCECRANVFVTDTGYLVIDIENGVADPASVFERNIDLSLPSAAADDWLGAAALPVILPRGERGAPILPFTTPPRDIAVPAVQQPQPTAVGELDALEQLVLENLGRGLSTGVLVPDLVAIGDAPDRPPQGIGDVPLPGVAISTGIDPAAIRSVEPPLVNDVGEACASDAFFDIVAWADNRPFAVQLAGLRSAMTHEFDRFDPQVIRDLARFYIHYGFGREAVQTLALDGVRSQERSYLELLARIMDEDVSVMPKIGQQLSCRGRVALWAFLAVSDARLTDDGQRSAVLQTFKDLPVLLQKHLGPQLAERFASIGDDDAAHQALAVAQSSAPQAVNTMLATAMLEERRGDPAVTLTTLSGIANTNARTTPEAMIRYLAENTRQNSPASVDDMLLADAIRFEHALTPAAGGLAAAQIYAYLVADDFGQAARLIEDEKSALGPDRYLDVKSAFGVAAVDRMEDADFLAFAFGDVPSSDDFLLHEKIAERLLVLGFPDQSLNILSIAEQLDVSDSHRYLQSAALLELRDTDAVLRLLADDISEQADTLRQAARAVRAGNDAPPISGEPSEIRQADWRSGNWANLMQTDDPIIQAAVNAMLNQNDSSFDTSAPLASGRALLDEAAITRNLVDGLLEQFPSQNEE